MAPDADHESDVPMNVVTRNIRSFGLLGGRVADPSDPRLTETATLRGLNGDEVITIESTRSGRLLACGCFASSIKSIAGECQSPGCGRIICKDHAGECEAEGKLMCREHLCQVRVRGETRTYCRRCAWRHAFWQMLLGD